MLGEFGIETCPRVKWSQIVNYSCGKCRSGGFSGRKPPPRGQRSISECAVLTLSFDKNNSDGKASLKRQKSPEITTDTQDVIKFYRFILVIALRGVQFGLKSYVWFEITSMISDQNCTTRGSITTLLHPFWNRPNAGHGQFKYFVDAILSRSEIKFMSIFGGGM